MVVPVDREGKVGDSSLLRRDSPSTVTQPVNTRKAGGRSEDKGPQMVYLYTCSCMFIVNMKV